MSARQAYAYGYGLGLAFDAALGLGGSFAMPSFRGLGLLSSAFKGGANAAAHPAKHEVARADLAGKTGITGGPSTRKPAAGGGGKVVNGRMRMPSNIDWPSRDAKRKVSRK